ncbi:splicing factor 1-like [Cervus elaphus]|uniref:splicing factor 1-like n=1 Tax=Cervus elaphus TaxID=9860 RepID=UPI001CC2BBBC|nr:splicing factor 1-like [Cervus elaphus]
MAVPGSSSPRPINSLCARGPGPPPKPSPGAQTWERARRHASAAGNRLHPRSNFRWVAIATTQAVTHGGPPGRGSRGAPHRTAADLAPGRGLHRPQAARGRRESLFLRPALAPPPPPPNGEPPGGIHAESAAASRGGLPPSPSPASQHSQRRSLWEQNFHLQNVSLFSCPEWTTDGSGTLEKVLFGYKTTSRLGFRPGEEKRLGSSASRSPTPPPPPAPHPLPPMLSGWGET